MKTAVLISGHMRSFKKCLPTIAWHVLRHYPEADFFVSTVNDDDAKTAELLRTTYPKARVEIEYIEAQPELPIPVQPSDPKWMPNQNRIYTHEPFAISVHPQAIVRQLWHLQRVWENFEKARHPAEYDTVIRLRPDSYFRSFVPPKLHDQFTATSHGQPVTTAVIQNSNHAFTPVWGRFGGCNDRFAVLGMSAALAYFTTYGRIPLLLGLGCPLHPESLVAASLWRNNVQHSQKLSAWFSKLIWDHGEKHGTFREPEVSQIDAFDATIT